MPSPDNALHYRRGIVLGLTLAETFLLLLFVLLLTISLIRADQIRQNADAQGKIEIPREQFEKVQSENEELKEEFVALSDLIEQLNNPANPSDPKRSYTDAFNELRRDRKQTEQKNSALQEENAILQKKIDELQEENTQAKKELQEKTDKLSIYQENEQTQEGSETKQGQLEKILRKSGLPTNPTELEKVLERSETKQTRLENALKKEGAGGISDEPPSCWIKKVIEKGVETEQNEYIFDITLQSEGLKIYERKIPSRNEDKKKLPMDRIDYEKMMRQENFVTSTKPFLEWGIKNDCRFYVRVFDYTGEQEKLRYKDLLQTVEHSFYKYSIRDNTTTRPGQVGH